MEGGEKDEKDEEEEIDEEGESYSFDVMSLYQENIALLENENDTNGDGGGGVEDEEQHGKDMISPRSLLSSSSSAVNQPNTISTSLPPLPPSLHDKRNHSLVVVTMIKSILSFINLIQVFSICKICGFHQIFHSLSLCFKFSQKRVCFAVFVLAFASSPHLPQQTQMILLILTPSLLTKFKGLLHYQDGSFVYSPPVF